MSNIFSQLNKHYSLNDFVTLSEISTEKDKRKAEKADYNVGFTRKSGERNSPPSRPAELSVPKANCFRPACAIMTGKGFTFPSISSALKS